MMQQQIDRWTATGIWDTISEIKETFIEPKSAGDLNEFMTRFREVIAYTGERPVQGITGAIMFAVFRGKVAEGIDFSDNEARCVIAVSISFCCDHIFFISHSVNCFVCLFNLLYKDFNILFRTTLYDLISIFFYRLEYRIQC